MSKIKKAAAVLEKTGCAIISCNPRDRKNVKQGLLNKGINFNEFNFGFILLKEFEKKEEKK